jgi:hypothetical protein
MRVLGWWAVVVVSADWCLVMGSGVFVGCSCPCMVVVVECGTVFGDGCCWWCLVDVPWKVVVDWGLILGW